MGVRGVGEVGVRRRWGSGVGDGGGQGVVGAREWWGSGGGGG